MCQEKAAPPRNLVELGPRNRHLDAAEKSIKRRLPSSRSGLCLGNLGHVPMGITAA